MEELLEEQPRQWNPLSIESNKEELRKERQAVLNIAKKHDMEKIKGMERQLEVIRREIQIEYQALGEQQNKCTKLDKKANEGYWLAIDATSANSIPTSL